jgi:hypothetical protein
MPNKRIYYAIQQVTIGTAKAAVHGLQSAAITTNFNLEQVFELGQLEIYQNIENIPEIEVTLNKVLDGYAPIYILATEGGTTVDSSAVATGADLAGRQNARADLELSIYPDNQSSAAGNALNAVKCFGMYVSSVSYTFPVDGNFTEDVTLVGNDKIWGQSAVGLFPGNDDSPAALSVNRRQHLDIDACVFPTQIPGIDSSGKNNKQTGASGVGYNTHFQNITVSCDLGRETIFELGSFAPYTRYVTFPVEVTSEFEVLAIDGDAINATEDGYYAISRVNGLTVGTPAPETEASCLVEKGNLLDQSIYLATCEGLEISLGNKNKLTSVNYSGGDTGGGNVTVTYSFVTYNAFSVTHTTSALKVL